VLLRVESYRGKYETYWSPDTRDIRFLYIPENAYFTEQRSQNLNVEIDDAVHKCEIGGNKDPVANEPIMRRKLALRDQESER